VGISADIMHTSRAKLKLGEVKKPSVYTEFEEVYVKGAMKAQEAYTDF
jgi:hypothetical protein